MSAVAVPIQPGKIDTWKNLMKELSGPRKKELEALNKRHGLTKHQAFLQRNPDGTETVIAVHEGPGSDRFLMTLSRSQDDFDKWFRAQLEDIHGMSFDTPPTPPERVLDSNGG